MNGYGDGLRGQIIEVWAHNLGELILQVYSDFESLHSVIMVCTRMIME